MCRPGQRRRRRPADRHQPGDDLRRRRRRRPRQRRDARSAPNRPPSACRTSTAHCSTPAAPRRPAPAPTPTSCGSAPSSTPSTPKARPAGEPEGHRRRPARRARPQPRSDAGALHRGRARAPSQCPDASAVGIVHLDVGLLRLRLADPEPARLQHGAAAGPPGRVRLQRRRLRHLHPPARQGAHRRRLRAQLRHARHRPSSAASRVSRSTSGATPPTPATTTGAASAASTPASAKPARSSATTTAAADDAERLLGSARASSFSADSWQHRGSFVSASAETQERRRRPGRGHRLREALLQPLRSKR